MEEANESNPENSLPLPPARTMWRREEKEKDEE